MQTQKTRLSNLASYFTNFRREVRQHSELEPFATSVRFCSGNFAESAEAPSDIQDFVL
jgi:hypothetical protein